MILVDANLLIYAVDADSPHHERARIWLENTLSGTTRVGLAWIVLLAFTRITTRSSVLNSPLSLEAALTYVESWLEQPFVTVLSPGDHHWPVFRNLLVATGTAGNLVSDVHLAALAIEHGCEVVSADNDFKRFPGIHHSNPLQS